MSTKNAARPLVVALALVVTITMALVAGGTANAGRTISKSAAPVSASRATVADTNQGSMTTRIVGTTGNDRRVTGKFYPLDFRKTDAGTVKVRGLLVGVVHNADDTTSKFTALRSLRVKTINGTPATTSRTAAAAATCDILHLVLAPLDLDLLGLQVHLDRVVLDIVAESGAGNLLGNLLCAVTGLLDGGLDGVLGRLVNLLDQILGLLRSGL